MIDAVAARREAGPGTGPSPIRWAAAGLMLVEAATFLLASALHRGVQIPLGFVTLIEPTIGPAAIVETTCGLALFIAAITVLAGNRWGWLATVVAHLLAAGGVVLLTTPPVRAALGRRHRR